MHEPQVIPRIEMDFITFEVLRNAFRNVTEQMALVVRRAAYSTNVKTRGDFSAAFFDAELRSIAQSGQPGHLMSMASLIPHAVTEYGIERMQPGDIFLVNDPHRGASHLNDINCFMPIFADEALLGFVCNLAHHVEVGGASPASLGIGTEIYQEGIILPPVRIASKSGLNEDLVAVLVENVRSPREVYGDLRAQMSANWVAAQRLAEIVDVHSVETIERFFEELMSYTDRWIDHEIRALPQGTFRAESYRDDDGISDEPLRLVASVTIANGQMTLDVSGSSPQCEGPMNATRVMTRRALAYVFKCLADRRVPDNSAIMSRILVAGPDGLVVTAKRPAAVVGGFETLYQLCSTVFLALHPAMPERIAACSKSLVVNLGFAGVNTRMDGEFYCYMETVGGGNGARPTKDGPDAVQTDMQNTSNAPIEEVELNYPMMVERYELRTDSGGPGRYRGGLGLRRDLVFPYSDCIFTIMSDGRKFAPWGLAGGQSGSCARFVLEPETIAEELPSKVTRKIPKGGCVSIQTPGGGGFGNPTERDHELIVMDILDEKISLSAASEAYGFDGEGRSLGMERHAGDEASIIAGKQLAMKAAGVRSGVAMRDAR